MTAATNNWEEQFNVIFHAAPDVIIIVDGVTGDILNINQTVEDVLGYKRIDLIGKPFNNLFPSSVAPNEEDIRIHDAAFAGQDFLRADGTVCAIDLTINMISWQDDDAFLITLRDVTERFEAEKAREQLIQELNAFAHTVAHDLKAPLNTLLVAATALEEYGEELSEEERQQFSTSISRGSHKMRNIIDELLLLAQLRSTDVETTPIDMSEVVAGAINRLSYVISQTQTRIILPEKWLLAAGYAPWIEEVWANYISNAIKYGTPPPLIELGSTELEGSAEIQYWIQDNGKGLTEEEQTQLFTPFTQLSIRSEGHGLGLSIVQRIVERLGGEVGVESTVGQGSTFSFTLPKA